MIRFFGIILFGCYIIAVAGCSSKSKQSETVAGKPNIIYILADDMGYGDLSCYGQKNFTTPTLDSLAASGIRFTNHYAGSPVCAPSRASLMTGRDGGHSRVRGNYEKGPYGFGAGLELLESDVTIAQVLKMAGYNTALIGKWGLGMTETTGGPNKKGFDYFYGFLNQAHAHYQFPDYLYRNKDTVEIKENKGGKNGKFTGDLFTEESIHYINQQSADQPFFLYLSYVTPHAELIVPEDSLFESMKGKFKEVPFVKSKQGSNGQSDFGAYRSQQYPFAAYATMIRRMDQDIKSILAALKRKGLTENTVIMFTSDNGPHKEGGANPLAFNSSGGLRGAKRDVYEGGIREPFIINWPAGIKEGRVSDHISAFWDIMPTFAELAGVDLKKNNIPTEGISLLPVIKNEKNISEHKYLYWEFHENKTPDQAVRMGKWKGVRHGTGSPVELYDLSADRAETTNVAEKYPQVVEQIEGILEIAREPNEYWPLNKSKDKKNKSQEKNTKLSGK